MPIYEYYCPDNHTIYQFYAKTLAQGAVIPKCPANPRYRLVKMLSSFAVTSGGKSAAENGETKPMPAEANDPKMDAAMTAMEKEFTGLDENDPKAMGRMMRRMAEFSGEKIDGQMEEVVRKLEEGADLEAVEAQLGLDDADGAQDAAATGESAGEGREGKHRFRARNAAPARDPALYDYE